MTHGVLVICTLLLILRLHEFFHPLSQAGERRGIDRFLELSVPCLLWAAPLWGVVWAWLYVRLANRWLERARGLHCLECGYDLTGNVSGRCPECGQLVIRSEPHA